jgi:hypothetical protein
MPTGYTEKIKDGITFEQFALGCARAFGALVTMRDEPANAPIPERFEPFDYHQKALEKAHGQLSAVSAMTVAELSDAAKKQYEADRDRFLKLIAEKNVQRASYDAMLAQVNAWMPPTDDHQGLKDFMVEQISRSIDFDCAGDYYESELKKVKQMTADEYKADLVQRLHRDLQYHDAEHRKEVERAASRTAWVKALRESLGA